MKNEIEFKFGDYAIIEQKRHGVPNEMFVHKVVGQLRSNTWVDVPVMVPATETLHGEMEDICLCICCGVDETEVRRYRVKDMRRHSPVSAVTDEKKGSTITLQAVNELIASLESAGELSIRERKYLELAKATPGEWVYFPKNTSIEYDVGSDESQGSILYVDSGDFTQVQTDRNGEFIALANPVNVIALVEALEKAQQVDEELCNLLPPGAEYMDPPDGGDVTPLEGVRRMVADYRQLIAELESRTVNVKLPTTIEPAAFSPWVAKAFYQFHKDTVKSCFAVFSDACAAAGIKVEAE